MAKHKHEEHENHERWLVSYADFITLLFAFFVVMYSVSSVNEGKYRTVSESIKAALHPVVSQPASAVAIAIGDQKPKGIAPELAAAQEPVIRKLRSILKSLREGTKLEAVQIVARKKGEIVITVPDQVLFDSGEAVLRQEALPFLQALAEVLVEFGSHIKVQGHTDNVPIRKDKFQSNWELSAGRSVAVVRTLSEQYGVPVQNLSAEGYADSRPLTDNVTPEHRAKNRRVEIVVLESHPALQSAEPAEEPTALEWLAHPPDRAAHSAGQGYRPIEPPVTGLPR